MGQFQIIKTSKVAVKYYYSDYLRCGCGRTRSSEMLSQHKRFSLALYGKMFTALKTKLLPF